MSNISPEALTTSPEQPAPEWRELALDLAIDRIVVEEARAGNDHYRLRYIDPKRLLVGKDEVTSLVVTAYDIYGYMFGHQDPDLVEEKQSLTDKQRSLEIDLEAARGWEDSELEERAAHYYGAIARQYPEELGIYTTKLRRYEGFTSTLEAWQPSPEFSGLRLFVQLGLARAMQRHVAKAPAEPREMDGQEFKTFLLAQYESDLQAVRDRLSAIHGYWETQARLSTDLDNFLI